MHKLPIERSRQRRKYKSQWLQEQPKQQLDIRFAGPSIMTFSTGREKPRKAEE